MPTLQQRPRTVVGFDVAKDTITVFDGTTEALTTIANTKAAVTRLVKGLDADCLAVLEPTGGHEALLLQVLVREAIPSHRVDTIRVKAFIRSLGTLAKTDALDARALSHYGQERWDRLALFTPPDEDVRALASLVTRRRQLVEMRVAETNRAKTPGAALKRSIDVMLRTLDRQIGKIEEAIDALIEKSAPLRETTACYRSLNGIGPRTAVALAAFMPELGSLSRRQAAALAAVAPHPNDSGTLQGYRSMRGGRPQVRSALFMAALAASRAKGNLADFYDRLVKNGKKPIVAIAALMRKIIVILNARRRDGIKEKQS